MAVEYKASQLDIANATRPIWVVAGPVMTDVAFKAPKVLDKMASFGPEFRVGLVPSGKCNRWSFVEEPGWWSAPRETRAEISLSEILNSVAGNPVPTPIHVVQFGDYLCVGFDHGIGDSHILMEILAALTHDDADKGFVEPLPIPNTRHPLSLALLNVAKSAPTAYIGPAVGALPAAWSFGKDVIARMGKGSDIGPAVPTGERYIAIFAKSDMKFINEVRRCRDSRYPKGSATAIIIVEIYRSLQEADIPLDDDVEVVVDLRRFLPPGKVTMSNFFGVNRVNVRVGGSIEAFSGSLKDKVESVRPLLKLAVHLGLMRARTLLPRRNLRSGQAAEQPASRRSVLTISDVSKLPATSKLAWARPDDAELAVVLPPGDRSHIAIALWTAPNDGAQVTATFFSAQADESRVREGLRRALSSTRFKDRYGMTSSSNPSERPGP